MNKTLRVGLDIDGTISTYPRYFSDLSRHIMSSGGRVVVISSRSEESREETNRQLEAWAIQYDALYLFRPYDQVELLAPASISDWYDRFLWQKLHYAKVEFLDTFYEDEARVIALFKQYMPNIGIVDTTSPPFGRSLPPIFNSLTCFNIGKQT